MRIENADYITVDASGVHGHREEDAVWYPEENQDTVKSLGFLDAGKKGGVQYWINPESENFQRFAILEQTKAGLQLVYPYQLHNNPLSALDALNKLGKSVSLCEAYWYCYDEEKPRVIGNCFYTKAERR